ncbi:hypothetical protein C923_02513 [Plasmodium falciparum UGT5.1]|uniref:Uncharacterized protein n=1 Tax=Plasmodium falciparum UGT5.1 TaxID=1237627 RepID=W7JP29_PLAFA|nr:hypothetical protein C923_02513 [Plasmodium falciparum UGT5.1]
MIRKLEYHIISYIIFALHVKLFMHTVFYAEWVWDLFHIYFCTIIVYVNILLIYGIRIYFGLKKLDLKYFPLEKIASCTNYKNKKNIHPYAAFERLDLINMKFMNLFYGIIFVATWKIAFIFFLSLMNLMVSRKKKELMILQFYVNYQGSTLRTYWLPKVYPPDKAQYPDLTDEERINIFHDEVSKIMFNHMKKYNPRAPKDVDDYNDWPGSLRFKLEYFQNALGNVATKHLNKEKNLSEK